MQIDHDGFKTVGDIAFENDHDLKVLSVGTFLYWRVTYFGFDWGPYLKSIQTNI